MDAGQRSWRRGAWRLPGSGQAGSETPHPPAWFGPAQSGVHGETGAISYRPVSYSRPYLCPIDHPARSAARHPSIESTLALPAQERPRQILDAALDFIFHAIRVTPVPATPVPPNSQ